MGLAQDTDVHKKARAINIRLFLPIFFIDQLVARWSEFLLITYSYYV